MSIQVARVIRLIENLGYEPVLIDTRGGSGRVFFCACRSARHEKPTDPDDPLADQNIKDRYYGVNDPVADKLLRRAAAMPRLEPPEDKTITTLYVGNLGEKLTEKDIRDYFYQFGEIRSITVIARQQCAFVQFTARAAAELAAERSFHKLIIHGRRLNIKWGRSQAKAGLIPGFEGEGKKLEPVPGLPGALPPPPEELTNNYFNLTSIPPPSLQPPTLGLPTSLPPPIVPPGLGAPPPATSIQSGQPFLGPPGVLPPGPPPLRPPPGVRPTGPPPPGYPITLPNVPWSALGSNPLAVSGKPTIHYPSQDPHRLGSTGMSAPQ